MSASTRGHVGVLFSTKKTSVARCSVYDADFWRAACIAALTGVKMGLANPNAVQEAIKAADDVLELKFALWSEKGVMLDCSERSGATVKLARTDLPLPFMKEAAGLLRKGARLRFEVPPDLCFGAQPQGPALPANSVTIWELELVGTNVTGKQNFGAKGCGAGR